MASTITVGARTLVMQCDMCGKPYVQRESEPDARIPYPDGWNQFGMILPPGEPPVIVLDICDECTDNPIDDLVDLARHKADAREDIED